MPSISQVMEMVRGVFLQFGILQAQHGLSPNGPIYNTIYDTTRHVVQIYTGGVDLAEAVDTFVRNVFRTPDRFYDHFLTLYQILQDHVQEESTFHRLQIDEQNILPDTEARNVKGNLRFVNGQLQYYDNLWIAVLPERLTQTFQNLQISQSIQLPDMEATAQIGNLRYVNKELQVHDGKRWIVVQLGAEDGEGIGQGGNGFGEDMIIGTLDPHDIQFITDDTTQMVLTTDGELILGTGDNQVVLTPNPHVQFYTDGTTQVGWETRNTSNTILAQTTYDPVTQRLIWYNTQYSMALHEDRVLVVGGTDSTTSDAVVLDPLSHQVLFQVPDTTTDYTLAFTHPDGGNSVIDAQIRHQHTGQFQFYPHDTGEAVMTLDGPAYQLHLTSYDSLQPAHLRLETPNTAFGGLQYHDNGHLELHAQGRVQMTAREHTDSVGQDHAIVQVRDFPLSSPHSTSNHFVMGALDQRTEHAVILEPELGQIIYQNPDNTDYNFYFRAFSSGSFSTYARINWSPTGQFHFYPNDPSEAIWSVDGVNYRGLIQAPDTLHNPELHLTNLNGTGAIVYDTNNQLRFAVDRLNTNVEMVLSEIGTLSIPNHLLVSGSISVDSSISANRSISTNRMLLADGRIQTEDDAVVKGNVIAEQQVGIGTSSPESALQVSGSKVSTASSEGIHAGLDSSDNPSFSMAADAGTVAYIDFTNINNDFLGRIRYDLGTHNLEWHTNQIQRMILTGAGRLGVGTSSPEAPLHVDGEMPDDTPNTQGILMGTSGTSHTSIEIVAPNSTAEAFIDFTYPNQDRRGRMWYNMSGDYMGWQTATGERMRLTSEGRLGIGTSTPENALHVAHQLTESRGSNVNGIRCGIDTGGNPGLQFVGSSTSLHYIDFIPTGGSYRGRILYDQDRDRLDFRTSGSTRAWFDNGGNFGNGDWSITLGGDAFFVSVTETSDESLKQDIVSYDNQQNTLKLIPRQYRMTHSPDRLHTGFVAQEVETVMPEAIHTGVNNKKGIDLMAMIASLVSTIQTMNKELQDLRAQIGSS